MGGAVSSGRNNDDLIDNLLEADYIKSSLIERVFRAVDRAEYFLPDARGHAYKDLAWKSGNLHLSAPCIYSEVMEGLALEPGMSFLNLGSGTGYLSTMVGLILGTNGINHGIEIHEDVIQYANKKLEDFKKYSGAIDEYDFCEPKFKQGNCLRLTSECIALYDRIYCGAACPEQFELYMKSLLKVGGFLVMPINDQLLQIKRTSDIDWTSRTLLPVSFASLIVPHEDFQECVGPIDVEPLSLQVLCRAVVRNILRKNIESEHPPIKRPPPVKAPKKKRALKRLVVPLFDDEDSSEEERHVRLGGDRNRDAGRATFRRDDDNIFSFFLGIGGRRGSGERPNQGQNRKTRQSKTKDESMETDSTVTEDNSSSEQSNSHQVRAVIEHNPNPENDDHFQNQNHEDEHSLINEISDVIVECLSELRRERSLDETDENNENEQNELNMNEENSQEEDRPAEEHSVTEKPSASTSTGTRTKKNGKREKFDSGLGDEIIEAQDSSDEDDNMKLDAISSCDEDPAEKRHKRDTSSSDNEEDSKQTDNEMKMYQSPFTEHIKAKIQQLPLPPILKRYLNFYREF